MYLPMTGPFNSSLSNQILIIGNTVSHSFARRDYTLILTVGLRLMYGIIFLCIYTYIYLLVTKTPRSLLPLLQTQKLSTSF